MHQDFHEEEPRDGTRGDLIADNVRRIKDSIYGPTRREPAAPRTGTRTSSRSRET
jgi:hypothetical protein